MSNELPSWEAMETTDEQCLRLMYADAVYREHYQAEPDPDELAWMLLGSETWLWMLDDEP